MQEKKNPTLWILMGMCGLILLVLLILIGNVIANRNQNQNQSTTIDKTYTSSESGVTKWYDFIFAKPETDPDTLGSITQLVNGTHTLPADYEPADLVYLDLPSTQETYMRSEAAKALTKMFNAASAQGVELLCCSGYRSYEEQAEIIQNSIEENGEEATYADTALPGCSEHQTGLTMDVTSNSVGQLLTQNFINTTEGQWIADHAHEYGFIVRYPNGKEAITGYTYEPWHLRYLGKDVAKSVYKSGLTYEEYLESYN